ncbi:MAG: type VI secretion system contractile sheath small subunit [Verrucomicrobiales bacterium]|nr:type VI secretion system contractile sheath small subunit [Verrucomicrobiales bacterium]
MDTQEDLAKTRVDIKVKVETGNGIEEVELPFAVGVFADLAGDSAKEAPPMAEREFTDVTEDNLDQFMRSLEVALDLDLPDHLTGTEKVQKLRLELSSMRSFRPEELVLQGPLKELKELRDRADRLHAAISGTGAESEMDQLIEELKGLLKNPETPTA